LSNRILVVDDERNMRRVLQGLLQAEGYDVDGASDGDEARALLRKADPSYDLVLTDLRMPNSDGMDLLRAVKRRHPDTPVILITAHGTVDTAVEAMREGAFDFITKPFDNDELALVVNRGLARREANRERAYDPLEPVATTVPPSLRRKDERVPEKKDAAGGILSSIIGVSPPMQELFALLRKVAPSPTTILLQGESGTGKELVATAIHKLSKRADGPFITVNCTAIPEMLFESELFGHEKGAFTGATARRPGRFELADQGTLLLDEIGELPPAMQVKLLRVLQERVVERVGGLRPVPIDVRLVAATNADLERMVQEGRFREDLFYRLNVVPIRLPPLRERPTDIPVLIRHFIEKFRARLGRDVHGITPEAELVMVRHSWPGNIRQLENAVERMVLLTDGTTLTIEDVPPEVRRVGAMFLPSEGRIDPETVKGNLKAVVRLHTQQLEREVILQKLKESAWNVTHAARKLGISRKGLQLKMKDYDLRDLEGGG
jgi:DNA-binding NtrC family response regulator